MAIIKLGATVVGIRGTIGGVTYSQNKSGPYARTWSRGSNPKTPLQQAQRSALSQIPALWRALSDLNQNIWSAWAALPAQERTDRFGDPFYASGYNWFTLINTRLINMGRATRTAVPVSAVPAAPTITSLVLPFLPQQATKITYPSGEFGTTYDQVIEIFVALSTGRIVETTNYLQLLNTQTPPDEDSEFVTPYAERWNLEGASRKGFARVYRQTHDGQRSAAGTATFVSTDTPPYAAAADAYNATTNYGLRGADLTSNADSKKCSGSFWFKVGGGTLLTREVIVSDTGRALIILNNTDKLQFRFRNAANTVVVQWISTATFAAGSTWHSVQWSFNTTTSSSIVYIDGVAATPSSLTMTAGETIDMTAANWGFGATTIALNLWNGCLAEFWMDTQNSIDFTNAANRAKFVDEDGYPVDLGATGAFPTGSQPIIYFPTADPAANAGYGGNFVNNAALGACATDPPS